MMLQSENRGWDNFYMCIKNFMDGLAKKRTRGFGGWVQKSEMTCFCTCMSISGFREFEDLFNRVLTCNTLV